MDLLRLRSPFSSESQIRAHRAQDVHRTEAVQDRRCNEQTRIVLIEKMQLNGRGPTADDHEALLRRKLGRATRRWRLSCSRATWN
ncbi:hypothetical protein PENTCL1PPCAC_17838 [Pristionchus entomophagus]|uniref:Ribosomal protein n=1 Tax=Pristionchus entomophagus TaxID=358040 RepID=A0AAV5TN53_9BILA|nr:hypothetical protein PENTCL1PPCAC_17837 [Pristionchus entomophagus]GMS95663.1 hypothetical protein PENTCL1PPCAC_17838 [Pristionchus entomophagus]